MGIAIQGDGVAARCCGQLLSRSGFAVSFESGHRTRLPAIMIGASTQELFHDVFENSSICKGFYPISRRAVKWGPDETTKILPHAAVVADETTLLERLGFPAPPATPADPLWTIVASRPSGDPASRAFGQRIAFSLPVTLAPAAEPFTSWVEAAENGWLFLVANAPNSAWLLGVGDTPQALLNDSNLIRPQVAEIVGEARNFPAGPRIRWPLCGPNWLACGSGALAFDPLCGDGSGFAIREAILASAVVRASEAGGHREELLAHYRARMLAGFQKHLEVCESFYRSGGSTPWWTEQADQAHEGLRWCEAELRGQPAFRYALRGFDLHRLPG
jgi:hypothetical protein